MRRRKEEARIRDGSWSARKYHKSPTSKHKIYASTSPRLFIPQPTSCLPSPLPTVHTSPHSPPPVSPSTQSRKLQAIRISQVLHISPGPYPRPLVPIQPCHFPHPTLNLPYLHPTLLNAHTQKRQRGDNILSVDPAGIGPMARSPYPSSGGIVSFRLSPMHISRRPSSHLHTR